MFSVDNFPLILENVTDAPTVAEPTPGTYLIGVGRSDVTGPIVQVNMVCF